jgi:uncharacterized repeat protein (TIGR01451 family)
LNVVGADLAVTKTHTGNFVQGDTGKTYSISVSNNGNAASSGVVTVTESLPSGLNFVSMAGTGWTCDQVAMSCSRADTLAAGSGYPAITVTVNVRSNAPATVTNVATVSGGGEGSGTLTNNSASDPTTVNTASTIAPTNFIATAAPTTQVNLQWDAVTGASQCHVFRSDHHGGFGPIAVGVTSATDTANIQPGTTYVYYVECGGPSSNFDLATTLLFTDDPLTAGVTPVKAMHFTELRTAIDAVRTAAGLGAATYTNAITAGGQVKAIDVSEMRSALDTARAAIGVSAVSYSESVITGVTIKAAHIQELRNGTK